jgi:hypothetical protein
LPAITTITSAAARRRLGRGKQRTKPRQFGLPASERGDVGWQLGRDHRAGHLSNQRRPAGHRRSVRAGVRVKGELPNRQPHCRYRKHRNGRPSKPSVGGERARELAAGGDVDRDRKQDGQQTGYHGEKQQNRPTRHASSWPG